VHAHMVHANIFARLNRIFYPIPRLICTAHSNNEGGRLRMLAYRLTNGLSEVLTNVSQGASQHFEKLGAVKVGGIRTVYNGINLDAYSFNVENSKLNENLFFTQDYLSFLSVGRFHEAKDYPNLLYAIALLRQKINQNIMFYIAGDGELRYQVENLIQNLQLEDCVQLLGRRDDIPQLMNQTDFFILSSKYEGFGLVVAEAMACGAFVIATDCGGVGEVMGNTGILVSPENSEALAQAIQQAIALPVTDIVVNKEKARQRVEEKFSLESSVKTWLEIYEAK
ncbi:MAG: glycosyltransferase, partial [Acinetobacter sp.]